MRRGMRLHGTPLSHFTRKIRILLAELGVDFEFVRAPSVLAKEGAAYGDNPLRRVPALVDGEVMVVDSDHIARYLVGAHDPGDRLGVRSERVEDLHRLAVANGVMDNEVVLILAQRTGVDVGTRA
jgi:glutathione S-transferase